MRKGRTCEKMRRLMVLHVSGEAVEEQEQVLRRHVESCGGCADELREMFSFMKVFPGLPDAGITPVESGKIKSASRSALEEQHAPAFRSVLLRPALALGLVLMVVISVLVFRGGESLELMYFHDPEYFEIDEKLMRVEDDSEALWMEVYAGINGFY